MNKNITLIGMMGAGKSLISERLSRRLDDYVAVDTDVVLEYHHNQFIPDMFKEKGEEYFRDAESKILEMVYKKDKMIVALGGGAFERPENRELVKKNSYVIYLKASPETLYERVKDSTDRPLLKKGFSKDDVADILAKREANYMLADSVVVTDGKTADEVVTEILGIIND